MIKRVSEHERLARCIAAIEARLPGDWVTQWAKAREG